MRLLHERLRRFAQSHWDIQDAFGQGDRFVLRTVNNTIQHGEWNGLPGNGRKVSFAVVWIFRFDDGARIAEVWRTADDLSRVRTLGGRIVPPA